MRTVNEIPVANESDKSQASAALKEIGAFVSDGESDSGDDVDGGKYRNMKSNPHNQNTDSDELPFVRMVQEMCSIDSTIANNQQNPHHHKTAVINVSNARNGDDSNQNLQGKNSNKISDECIATDSSGPLFTNKSASNTVNISGGLVNGNTWECSNAAQTLSPGKRSKGALSELSQRLRRASRESSQSSEDGGGSPSHMEAGRATDEYVMVDMVRLLLKYV